MATSFGRASQPSAIRAANRSREKCGASVCRHQRHALIAQFDLARSSSPARTRHINNPRATSNSPAVRRASPPFCRSPSCNYCSHAQDLPIIPLGRSPPEVGAASWLKQSSTNGKSLVEPASCAIRGQTAQGRRTSSTHAAAIWRLTSSTMGGSVAPMEGSAQRDVKAGGVRLRLLDTGAGSPVLLIHGLFADHSTWTPIVEELSQDFRLIAPDLPGFGESEKPPAKRFPYGIDAFVECIADLYAALGVGPATVVGHGLGGAVALSLATRHAELVSRLVLIDAQCYPARLDLEWRLALLPVVGTFVVRQLLGRTAFRAFYRDKLLAPRSGVALKRIDHYYARFSLPPARESALATLRATQDTRSLVAQTGRVQMPTLVIWGRHDRMYPAGFGQRLAREIRGAGFELIDSGHCPHEERPKEVAAAISRFLRAERPSQDFRLVSSPAASPPRD